MDKQIMIAIGREFGSGGHEIAERIAKSMGIALFDKNLLEIVAEKNNLDLKEVEKFDEKSRNLFLSRKVNGFSNAIEDTIAQMQFDHLKECAQKGESFVVVGRCGDEVLKEYDHMLSIFILGDKEDKIARVMNKYQLSREDAIEKMARHDRKRRVYHDSLAKGDWGDAHAYDMCINSSRFGVEKTAEILVDFIKASL